MRYLGDTALYISFYLSTPEIVIRRMTNQRCMVFSADIPLASTILPPILNGPHLTSRKKKKQTETSNLPRTLGEHHAKTIYLNLQSPFKQVPPRVTDRDSLRMIMLTFPSIRQCLQRKPISFSIVLLSIFDQIHSQDVHSYSPTDSG